MRSDLEILKSLYQPILEEISVQAPALKGSLNNEEFWDYFNELILDVKHTGNELTNLLHSYKVAKAEYYTNQLEQIRAEYLSLLAIGYIRGNNTPTTELLIKTQFAPFLEELAFQKDIIITVTISERSRLKNYFSIIDEVINFDIANEEITAAFKGLNKKNERNSLKRQFNELEKGEELVYKEDSRSMSLVEEPTTTYGQTEKLAVPFEKRKTKTISLSFLKYAAAACFIGAMVWIGVKFYDTGSTRDNTEVAKIDVPAVPDAKIKPAFAEVEVTENIIPLQTETGMGFADVGSIKKLPIVIQNVMPRIQSIEDYLNKPQTCTSETTLRDTLVEVIKEQTGAVEELELLLRLSKSYIFDGEKLQLFQTFNAHVQNSVIKTADKKYYLMSGNNFYQLTISKQQQDLNKITDSQLIEKLERIVFDNKN